MGSRHLTAFERDLRQSRQGCGQAVRIVQLSTDCQALLEQLLRMRQVTLADKGWCQEDQYPSGNPYVVDLKGQGQRAFQLRLAGQYTDSDRLTSPQHAPNQID